MNSHSLVRLRNNMKRMKICIAYSIHHFTFGDQAGESTRMAMTVIMARSVHAYEKKAANFYRYGNPSLSLRLSRLVRARGSLSNGHNN
jgi:hypothetical protein